MRGMSTASPEQSLGPVPIHSTDTPHLMVHLGWGGGASPGPGSEAQRGRGTGPALQKARLQDVKR